MIAVIAALREELAAVLAAAADQGPVRTEVVAGRELHHASIGGTPVLLALSGVGKVAAAATAALLAERCEALIMIGTAGGLGPQVKTGDVVVASELLQHDLDARPLFDRWVSPSLGLARVPSDRRLSAALGAAAEVVCAEHRSDLAELGLAAPRWHVGLIISGDQFVATADASRQLRQDLPDALAVEMEGAAVAQVCRVAGIPFAVARTISDRADDDAAVDFPKFLAKVAAPYAHDLVVNALLRLG